MMCSWCGYKIQTLLVRLANLTSKVSCGASCGENSHTDTVKPLPTSVTGHPLSGKPMSTTSLLTLRFYGRKIKQH